MLKRLQSEIGEEIVRFDINEEKLRSGYEKRLMVSLDKKKKAEEKEKQAAKKKPAKRPKKSVKRSKVA